MNILARYDAACAALTEAVNADEVMKIRLEAKAIEAVARVAKNFDFEIKGAKLRLNAEARLGEMMLQAEAQGLLGKGRPPNPPENGSAAEPFPTRATLAQMGIDKKLSAGAKRLASISERARQAMFERFERESRQGRRIAMEVIHGEMRQRNASSRRKVAETLSEASAALTGGRRFPAIYADPPWRRKAGIGDRAYENHFPTMTWDDICALPVAERALPDAWLFLWMPRAHLLASTPMAHDLGGEHGSIEVPLAWRVAHAWGFPHYSTCFVWTKTDDEFPDDQGTGLIAFDQDELLLLFKRGQGLPMPDTGDKFGSNHRERAREHSRKPDFYRQMIATMTKGLPVLELFARMDADHPLPDNWAAWGNQALPNESIDPETGEVMSTTKAA